METKLIYYKRWRNYERFYLFLPKIDVYLPANFKGWTIARATPVKLKKPNK